MSSSYYKRVLVDRREKSHHNLPLVCTMQVLLFLNERVERTLTVIEREELRLASKP